MEKAVLYVRVSSKEQKEEGYSIPAQKKLIREYAKTNGLEIVAEFEEVETAKRAGRTEFGKMIRFLKKNRGVSNILVEKTDRLYRNFRDLVKIDDLGRIIHFVKEGQVLSKEAKSNDKLIHNLKVVLAKNYIDNLSEESSKGMLEKAEQGYFPSYTPIGYINNTDTGGIYVDDTKAAAIRTIFEEYAEGKVSMKDLTKRAYEIGLKSRGGKKIQKSSIALMLHNPIYIGDFRWKGKYYKGKHEAIVSRDTFNRVQNVLGSRNQSRRKEREFAFRGLLRCGTCGCLITAEIKKEQYVYYRCTRGRGNCTEKPIREEELAERLGEPLKRLKMTNERLEWILEELRKSHEDEKYFHEKEVKRLQDESEAINRKVDKLYEDKISGVIQDQFWKRKYEEYIRKQNRIDEKIMEHRNAKLNYLENGKRILELAQQAYSLYVKRDSFKKRKLLDTVLSNSVLKGGEVRSEFRKDFATIADGVEEEEKLIQQKASKNTRNQNWLPG